MNAECHKLIKPNRATSSAKNLQCLSQDYLGDIMVDLLWDHRAHIETGCPNSNDSPNQTCECWCNDKFHQQDRICSTPLESVIPHLLDLPIQNLEKTLCMENEHCDTGAIGAQSLVNLQIPTWDPSPLSATPELLSPITKQYWRFFGHLVILVNLGTKTISCFCA